MKSTQQIIANNFYDRFYNCYTSFPIEVRLFVHNKIFSPTSIHRIGFIIERELKNEIEAS